MLIRKRPDGAPAKVPGFTKLMPILIGSRLESTIYMHQEIELNKTIPFMTRWNENRPEGRRRLTVMQVLLTAMARSVAQRPWINRFVSNRRHYQRNNISFSFVTKKTLSDSGREANVTMPFRPDDTLDDVSARFARYVDQAQSDAGNKSTDDVDGFERLPVPMLRLILGAIRFLDRRNWITRGMIRLFPFYCTAFLTNVGSLGMNAPYHHNYELGNTGVFISLGKVNRQKALDDAGNIYDRIYCEVTYTFDERIVDGIYSGRTIKIIKHLVENPELLLEKPQISAERLAELGLTEAGWNLWAID